MDCVLRLPFTPRETQELGEIETPWCHAISMLTFRTENDLHMGYQPGTNLGRMVPSDHSAEYACLGFANSQAENIELSYFDPTEVAICVRV